MFLPSGASGDLAGLSCSNNTSCSLYDVHGLSSHSTLGASLLRAPATLAARGFTSFIDVQSRLSRNQNVATQLTTCILSGCSLICSLVALYWFWRMKRLFRHKLIMMLVFADIGRSFWYFTFTAVALAGSKVDTSTHFCQASGFLIQVAIEGADIAVLIIAVHTALQVFRPTPFVSRPGGLYPCRYPVYAFAVLYPLVMSSLAFIQGPRAFFYQGLPVCNLPIRPFWYRLAISWIPRYIIFLVTLGIAIAVYIRADFGSELNRFYDRRFSAFTRRGTVVSSNAMPQMPSLVFLTDAAQAADRTKQGSSAGHSTLASGRKTSDGTTLVGSLASIRRGSDASTANLKSNRWTPQTADFEHMSTSRITSPIMEEEHAHHLSSFSSGPGSPSSALPTDRKPSGAITKPDRPKLSQTRHRASETRPFGFTESRVRRETARRQLRLMFVYPIVYFFIWLVPFINHLTQYSNNFAQHPVFALTILTWISIASMGMVDALVFSIREKPWKHIPGSDGTFIGSFKFWKDVAASEKNRDSMSTTDHDAFAAAQRKPSIWSWLRRNTLRASLTASKEEHQESGHTRLSSLAVSGTGSPAFGPHGRAEMVSSSSGATRSKGATLETMHSWGFAQASDAPAVGPARQQEAYWFDRRLSLALGRTGVGEKSSDQGLGHARRSVTGLGIQQSGKPDDDDDDDNIGNDR